MLNFNCIDIEMVQICRMRLRNENKNVLYDVKLTMLDVTSRKRYSCIPTCFRFLFFLNNLPFLSLNFSLKVFAEFTEEMCAMDYLSVFCAIDLCFPLKRFSLFTLEIEIGSCIILYSYKNQTFEMDI